MRLPRVPAHEARSRTASFSIVFERLQAAKSVLCIVCGCKDSARRAQRKRKAESFSFALPSRRLSYVKIVQGERSAKEKLKVFLLALPSRRLSYEKIVQGERSAKEKLKDFLLALPSRRLSYEKIVQGERSAKEKLKDFLFALPSRRPQATKNPYSPKKRGEGALGEQASCLLLSFKQAGCLLSQCTNATSHLE